VDDQLNRILAVITTRIGEWYPATGSAAGGRVSVRVESDDRRVLNRVVRVVVTAGDTTVARLMVKSDMPDPAAALVADDRPRLVPLTAPGQRAGFEYDALRLLENRLADAGDARFVPIRALALLDEPRALVMEAFDGRPLNKLLLRSTVRPGAPALRSAALANAAGAWLRILHETPADDDRPIRQGSPEELAERFSAFGQFLAGTMPLEDLERIVEVGRATAATIRDLSVVISHGDFAPRNILVDRLGRIAVIDLLARWRAPRYEDLAGFLLTLRTSRANAATQGLFFGRAIDRLEPDFLAGYFGREPIPTREIRLFELLLLLDKWSARMIRRASGSGGGFQERLIDRYFDARSRNLARLLAGDL
jgi:aminoglycoside phosphotransferase (APT) family kinase protein